MPSELQKSLVITAKRGATKLRRQHDTALERQKAARLKHEELAHKRKLESSKEQFIIAFGFYERYSSGRCWKSITESYQIFNQLNSESARVKAVKEQIMIRVKGFGWEDLKHPWSKNNVPYTSIELMNHFVQVILTAEREREIPDGPSMNLPGPSEKLKLGTTTELEVGGGENANTVGFRDQMVQEAEDELNRRVADGKIDLDRERQTNIMPVIDENFVGYHIDYCFEYFDDEGDNTYLGWCDGIVQKVLNPNTRMVEIKWNEKKVMEGDPVVTRQKLLIRSWNPKHPSSGAWRQFLGDPNA